MVAFFFSFFVLHSQLAFCPASYAFWFSCFAVVLGHSHLQNHHQMIHIRLLAWDAQEAAVVKQLLAAVGRLDRTSV